MNILYIDQISCSFLTQLPLVIIIIIYLLSLKRKSIATWLITGFLTAGAFVILKEFLVTAMPWHSLLRFQIRPLVYIALYPGMIALLQFVYRFPHPVPERPREANVLLWLSVFIACAGLGMWYWQYHRFINHVDAYFSEIETIIECTILIEFVWAIIVLIRRALSFSASKADAPSGEKRRFIFALLRPQSCRIRGIQRLIGCLGVMASLLFFSLLLARGIISQHTYNILNSTGLLLAINILFCNRVSQLCLGIVHIYVQIGWHFSCDAAAILAILGWTIAPSF